MTGCPEVLLSTLQRLHVKILTFSSGQLPLGEATCSARGQGETTRTPVTK